MGIQAENLHSLKRKQGARVRRKETESEENQGTLLFFSNNCTEVWLIFSLTLSSAAQQCDSVIHIKNIYYLSCSFSCGLSLDIEYSSLLSTVGLCLSFHCLPSSQSSLHHTLPHGSRMYGSFLILDELSHPLLLIKPLDT